MPSPVAFSNASLRVQRLKNAGIFSASGTLRKSALSRLEKNRATSSSTSLIRRTRSTSTPTSPIRVTASSARSSEWARLNWRSAPANSGASDGLPLGVTAKFRRAGSVLEVTPDGRAHQSASGDEPVPVFIEPELRRALLLGLRQRGVEFSQRGRQHIERRGPDVDFVFGEVQARRWGGPGDGVSGVQRWLKPKSLLLKFGCLRKDHPVADPAHRNFLNELVE